MPDILIDTNSFIFIQYLRTHRIEDNCGCVSIDSVLFELFNVLIIFSIEALLLIETNFILLHINFEMIQVS